MLFEALLIEFATAMPVARVAAMTREHDTRIWRVLEQVGSRSRRGFQSVPKGPAAAVATDGVLIWGQIIQAACNLTVMWWTCTAGSRSSFG